MIGSDWGTPINLCIGHEFLEVLAHDRFMVSITAKYQATNKVTEKSPYMVGWPVEVYTSSCA